MKSVEIVARPNEVENANAKQRQNKDAGYDDVDRVPWQPAIGSICN